MAISHKRQVDHIVRLLDNITEKEARQLVLKTHGGLVEATPVATGWAQNNWIPSVAEPVTETDGSPKDIKKTLSLDGIAKILQWTFKQGSAFIVNNVPYIRRLNEGHSKQAPAAFVEKVLQRELSKAHKKRLGYDS